MLKSLKLVQSAVMSSLDIKSIRVVALPTALIMKITKMVQDPLVELATCIPKNRPSTPVKQKTLWGLKELFSSFFGALFIREHLVLKNINAFYVRI